VTGQATAIFASPRSGALAIWLGPVERVVSALVLHPAARPAPCAFGFMQQQFQPCEYGQPPPTVSAALGEIDGH